MARFCRRNHDTKTLGRYANGACRQCSKERDRSFAHNPAYANQAIIRKRDKKLWAIAHKGGFCQDCGFDFAGRRECAEFDHRKGRKIPRGHSIKDMSYERLKRELRQCDLVCANCHATRTARRARRKVR